MNKETFCAFPFNTIFLGPDAGIKTCCTARDYIGNLNSSNIQEIVFGQKAKDIRASIIEGKWHPQCSQCYELEAKGARTERLSTLKEYDNFKDATSDTFILEQIDLRWSNVCNLACNYCYEYFSSKWANIKGIKVNDLNSLNQDLLIAFIKENVYLDQLIGAVRNKPNRF